MPRGVTEICKCKHPKKCHTQRWGCGASSGYYSNFHGSPCDCKEFLPENWTVYNF